MNWTLLWQEVGSGCLRPGDGLDAPAHPHHRPAAAAAAAITAAATAITATIIIIFFFFLLALRLLFLPVMTVMTLSTLVAAPLMA